MPRAEAGSTKQLNNAMKSRGLQRLRWYCQICEKQCRDDNGFKCHVQSESHVRQVLIVGEDPKKFINNFSNQFQRDFLLLLRTSHGEKQIMMNHFYQEYIANKEHVHMNATKWPSLTEFAKHLGREGICRVEDTDKGLQIAWIDNSPEALRRADAVRKRERQDRGDEEREQALIRQQIERAKKDAEARQEGGDEEDDVSILERVDGEKVKLSFGTKPVASTAAASTVATARSTASLPTPMASPEAEPSLSSTNTPTETVPETGPVKVSMKMNMSSKPKNVFAAAKKNALGAKKAAPVFAPPKKMSEAERIMKEEIERNGKRGFTGPPGPAQKKMRM